MARFEPAFEKDEKGKIKAFKCQECGQRLKPPTKRHTGDDCKWYKDYSAEESQ